MTKNKITAACILCCNIVGALILSSCADFSDATKEIAAHIQLQLPDELTSAGALAGHTVTMTVGMQRLQAETDAQGVATFKGLVPDVYDISCSWELSADDYQQLTGKELTGGTSCRSSSAVRIEPTRTKTFQEELSITVRSMSLKIAQS